METTETVDRESCYVGDRWERCPGCGIRYRDFRTGYTYREVYAMLWSPSEDSRNWRDKTRGVVLGFWWQLKQGLWADHIRLCGGVGAPEYETEEREPWQL